MDSAGTPSARAIATTVDSVGTWRPASMRWTVAGEMPAFTASLTWVRPAAWRAFLTVNAGMAATVLAV